MRKPAYIFDVDGTLALKYPDRDVYDGSKAYLDTVNVPVAAILDRVRHSHHILIVTGRHAKHAGVTEQWLRANSIAFDALFTRGDNDFRPDHVVKREILLDNILPIYRVDGVFDDRDSVVQMWRDEGLTCFQVAPGDF